jgi:DNA primase
MSAMTTKTMTTTADIAPTKTLTRLATAVALATVLWLPAGCSKSNEEQSQQPPASEKAPGANTAAPTPSQPATPAAEIADEDLPIETDFEERAEAEITQDNYKAELEALEAELAAE